MSCFPPGWLEAHYEIARAEDREWGFLCRRCGALTGYLTKHAVLRHGDTDIDIMPAVQPTMNWRAHLW